MKRTIVTCLAMMALGVATAMAQYAPAGKKMLTPWGEKMDVNNVWAEYPRPIMKRTAWQNLNGLWKYAITQRGAAAPEAYEGDILVPFCVESSLSGVAKDLGADNELWYNREFTVPKAWNGKNVLLNFGAVDWRADVWVNGVKVGSHTGGYTAFSLDITAALNRGGKNTLQVRVYDGTDSGYQPRGKQVIKPEGIYYTAVSGIWQTVWMEPVAPIHITSVKPVADIDNKMLKVEVNTTAGQASWRSVAEVKVLDGGKVVASGKSINGQAVEVKMPNELKLWSPDSPFLYDIEIAVAVDGKQVDNVKSYVAMRKVGMKHDADGIMRLQLNDKDCFHFGLLDQGWWPDGLYTAPSYEAMIYDLDKTKEWGFNMIRKHVKVEPELWYNYCDKVGIIVWQDMPSGDKNHIWQNSYFDGPELVRSAESEANYRKEWKEIIDQFEAYQCINVWVPFNEAWGQFKTKEITDWTKQMDPTRLVNPASGGNYYVNCGDMLDMHNYPAPYMRLYDSQRANVLGEYGGIGYAVKGHLWFEDRNWGYVQFNSAKEVTDEYVKYGEMLCDFVKRGFTGAVYTQTTDCEGEVNGLMTYDRKMVKVDEARIREINTKIVNSLKK